MCTRLDAAANISHAILRRGRLQSTGANERRWNKVKDKLETIIDSFQLIYGAQLYS